MTPTENTRKGQFTASRKQLHRMAAIIALLKKQEWIPMKVILAKMAETEFTDGAYLVCKNRTIQRDIKVLQREYNAPIRYSKKEAAYTLYNKDWTFQVPALLNPDELLAIVIGGKLCQEIFPSGISNRVNRAVEEILRYNDSEVLTSELLGSLKVLADETTAISDEIFLAVFEAWQNHRLLRITYADKKGNTCVRDIEPHTLVFHEMRWSIKGYCHLRKKIRTFHVDRIQAAVMLPSCFEPSPEIINSVTPDAFLDFEKVSGVELEITADGKYFASTRPLHSKQSFVKLGEDAYRMYVPAVSLEKLVPWVLQQQGNARVESPAIAVEAVRKAIRTLADVCQAYDPKEIRQKTTKSAKN